jgi:predicted nucleotidyltransferase
MYIAMQRNDIIAAIKMTLQQSGVKEAYLFGSFARNEEKYNDIDIAIKPPKGTSLLDLAHMENVLEKKTGQKIDLGVESSIHPLIRKHFEAERVQLL